MTGQGEVGGVQREVVVAGDATLEWCQRTEGQLDHPTAVTTHDVVVGLVSEVVDGWPMSQVDVVDDAERRERVQRAIDGRSVDVGMGALHRVGELIGRDVVVG